MSTRKIKDAKDLSTNELIYFKGHAQATYMSDGRTVEEAINNTSNSGGGGNLSEYATKEEVQALASTISDIDTIRAGAAKGATALQTETYTGTITAVQANGTSVATSGTANIPAATTSKYGVIKLSSSTSSTSTSLAATASAVKAAYDLANGKQAALVSGTNIKTINGQSILGSGNITISGSSTVTKEISTTLDSYPTPDVIYMISDGSSVIIDDFQGHDFSTYEEYQIFFTFGGHYECELILPDYVQWANGKLPVFEEFDDRWHELNIIKVGSYGDAQFLAVLSSFDYVS